MAADRHRDFGTLLKAFVDELRVKRRSLSALQVVTQQLPRFFDHLKRERVRDIRRVNEAHLTSYVRRLATEPAKTGEPLSLAAQAHYFGAVRGFFGFLERRGFILHNPAQGMKRPRVVRLPKAVLTEAQARRLVHATSPWTIIGRRDRAILEVLYGSGLRLGECLRIDVSDLDLWAKTLLVRNGKGRKDRIVPITGRAVVALDAYLRESRPELVRDPRERALFLTRGLGGRPSKTSINLMVRRRAIEARIQGSVYPHLLRHACATHLLQGGADIRHVQELLGHTYLETTALYARVVAQDLQRVVTRSHPRERSWRRRPR